ncbi:MAG: hypothetical protein JWO36_7193 [Myxococcales bacterium]|nr:hypothetical protein [Myxococcales bacterium]
MTSGARGSLPDGALAVRGRSAGAPWLAYVAVLAAGSSARAQSIDQPVVHSDREVGLLPLIGGDSDNGFGGGAIGSIAGYDHDREPYRWRVEFGAFYATKGPIFSPSYEDGYALITIPELMNNRLRLEIRPSFTKDTSLRFYGIGNYAPDSAVFDPKRDTYQRLHPQLSVAGLWRLAPSWQWLVGADYTYNQLTFDPSSTVALEITDPNIGRSHSVGRIATGIVYDTRDNEITPTRGQYHQFKVRVSPRLGDAVPYQYEQADATVRFYTTLIPRRLVLAVRGVLDVQIGDVPFYELSRYEDTSAIGGGNGVRGVPAYRFYGKVKAFGNVELRTEATRFSAFDRRFILGFAGFFDAGRLWSDIRRSDPMIDGSGVALHYGVGGGVRIQQGRQFLVRADVAWSPDARPIAAYLLANHAF